MTKFINKENYNIIIDFIKKNYNEDNIYYIKEDKEFINIVIYISNIITNKRKRDQHYIFRIDSYNNIDLKKKLMPRNIQRKYFFPSYNIYFEKSEFENILNKYLDNKEMFINFNIYDDINFNFDYNINKRKNNILDDELNYYSKFF